MRWFWWGGLFYFRTYNFFQWKNTNSGSSANRTLSICSIWWRLNMRTTVLPRSSITAAWTVPHRGRIPCWVATNSSRTTTARHPNWVTCHTPLLTRSSKIANCVLWNLSRLWIRTWAWLEDSKKSSLCSAQPSRTKPTPSTRTNAKYSRKNASYPTSSSGNKVHWD